MSASSDTVFPVPEGISSTPWPYKHSITSLGPPPGGFWGAGGGCGDPPTPRSGDPPPPNLGIQGPFELQHIGELLGVDVIVGEVHQQPIHVQPGRGFWGGGFWGGGGVKGMQKPPQS